MAITYAEAAEIKALTAEVAMLRKKLDHSNRRQDYYASLAGDRKLKITELKRQLRTNPPT